MMRFFRLNAYLQASLIWLLGIGLLIVVDYALRVVNGNMHALGMHETLWFAIPLVLAVLAAYPLLRQLQLKRTRQTLLYTMALLVAAFFYYLIAIWCYIIGSGIDAL